MHSSVLGWLGAALSIALPWPQVWRSCVQRHTTGLSATAAWLTFALPIGWITYGLLSGERVQVITNTVTGGASLAVLVALLVARRELRTGRMLAASAGGAIVMLSAALGCGAAAALLPGSGRVISDLLGMVLVATSIVSAVPQPLALLRDRTQDLTGLSRLRWRLTAGAAASWLAYGALTGQPAVWLSASAGLTGALVVCYVLATRQAAPVSALPTADPANWRETVTTRNLAMAGV
ncbi:SemiSWEET transporter [Krasilnikovia sp. MM14-A1004]|uniref:SemiSWEET transporter n=1 Tax=Krasilnikovia sp. MM14-A1004 TaxID=3373541 RepID=UPI00399D34D2